MKRKGVVLSWARPQLEELQKNKREDTAQALILLSYRPISALMLGPCCYTESSLYALSVFLKWE